jgi:DUF4097 and DUF4098 domain-containing protein YvlB
MSERNETFTVGQSVRVVAKAKSGDITVVGGEPGNVRVVISGGGADDYDIDQVGDVVTVDPVRRGRFLGSSADIFLTVPETTDLELSTTSGDINIQSPVREVRAAAASGGVRADAVDRVFRANTASGDIRAGRCEDAEINTASGTIRLGNVRRSLRLNAASGDAFIGEVGESAVCKVASSDVRIDRLLGSELRVKAVSGDFHIGIPRHRTIDLEFTSMSGRLRNQLPPGDGSPSEKTVAIAVTAVSGDLILKGA